jgi:hypothetical protein
MSVAHRIAFCVPVFAVYDVLTLFVASLIVPYCTYLQKQIFGTVPLHGGRNPVQNLHNIGELLKSDAICAISLLSLAVY